MQIDFSKTEVIKIYLDCESQMRLCEKGLKQIPGDEYYTKELVARKAMWEKCETALRNWNE